MFDLIISTSCILINYSVLYFCTNLQNADVKHSSNHCVVFTVMDCWNGNLCSIFRL